MVTVKYLQSFEMKYWMEKDGENKLDRSCEK